MRPPDHASDQIRDKPSLASTIAKQPRGLNFEGNETETTLCSKEKKESGKQETCKESRDAWPLPQDDVASLSREEALQMTRHDDKDQEDEEIQSDEDIFADPDEDKNVSDAENIDRDSDSDYYLPPSQSLFDEDPGTNPVSAPADEMMELGTPLAEEIRRSGRVGDMVATVAEVN